MKLLGTAKLFEHRHETGALVRSYDLTPWGELPVFLGPIDQELPTGTTDRGNLRIELQTGKVFILEPGDPAPSQGKAGAVFPMVALVVGGLVLLNMFGKR